MAQPEHTEIIVNVFGRTDVGRTREHNEDAFVVADLTVNDASLQPSVRAHKIGEKGSLFMVADGMGGAAAGEIASQMAIEIVLKELRENWLTLKDQSAETFARALKRAAQSANQQIHGYAVSHQEFRGMGTTATIAGMLGDTLYIAQVGDSRGYLVRDGVAKQITKDQSLMQKLIEAGELTEEEAAQSERRNIILQALGPEPAIKVDLTFQRVRRGDTLVLCSDGLSGQVSKDEIAQVVSQEKDLVQACRRLIDLANEAGGPDNITVIIARFEGDGLNAESASEEHDVGHRVFALADANRTPTVPVTPVASEETTLKIRTSNFAKRDTLPGPIEKEIETDPLMAPTLETIDAAKPEVNPARRSRGMMIALALLALLVVFATWYAVRAVRKVQPEPPAAPAPASTP
jgi:protein phosphatase